MSGWQYDVSEEEQRAVELLRAKGWMVSTPTCPDCHGFGYVSQFSTVATGGTLTVSSGTFASKPCPRGCASPMRFYSTTGSL